MVTQKDVAKKAGVSDRTVCNYFNDPKKVTKRTKELVEKAIKELNYKPSFIATSLSTGKTKTIGFLCAQITTSFFHSMFIKTEKLLRDKGYNLIVCVHNDDTSLERYYLDMLYQRGVDGIITNPLLENIKYYLLLNIPIVTFDISCVNLEGANLYNCSSNLKNSIKKLIDKFYNQGCRKIAYLENKSYKNEKYININIKLEEYLKVIKEYGLEPMVYEGYGEYGIADYSFLENNLPQAILSENDIFAFNFMIYFLEKGINIKKECNIVGFDNFPISRQFNFDSVSQNSDIVSQNIISKLLDLLQEKPINLESEIIDCQYIDRGTGKLIF